MTKYTCQACGAVRYSADTHKENEPCEECGNHGKVASGNLSIGTPCEVCDPRTAPICTEECQIACPETNKTDDKCEICGSADRLTAVICQPVANNEFVAKATLCRGCKSTYASGYIRNYYSNLSLAANLVKSHRKRAKTIGACGSGNNKKYMRILAESFKDKIGNGINYKEDGINGRV